ncbi:sulfite exporter TauE/SafE family protein [Candidatus Venteria ishoeyi]|uniref:Probable membrane transporter protein n=1 Tax=Candidatus Venteria ishoeyi TaxID=1899563 RepID=A0A1H6FJF0_9GAMM|nr:sulfite exporter TauE/SafE family protein [Candidatus Venteria ishoeyi]SEH09144.1 Sulfite exporter TauE/SafE [Candidatus Venteria ishoeyi]SEH09273.1 Sulfite exporter TauE/SafE [Candidatus Venteria ishoeyi]
MDTLIQVWQLYGPLELSLALVAIAAGAMIQGAVGFGFALIAAPILMLIDPKLVPVPISIVALLMTGLVFWRDRHGADWQGLSWIYLGNLPGYALGAFALMLLPIRDMALLFAGLTLLAVGLSISHLRLSPVPRWLLPMGTASSFMGVTMAMNGPPVALTYQHASGVVIRGSLSVYFFTSNLVLLLIFAAIGQLDGFTLATGVLLLPGVILGLLLASPLARWVDAGRMRRAVLWISALSALAVLVRYGY